LKIQKEFRLILKRVNIHVHPIRSFTQTQKYNHDIPHQIQTPILIKHEKYYCSNYFHALGNSYYVLTAKHVVENQKTQQLTTNNKIITYDQENYTSTSIVVATGLDLAVIKFTSQSNYPTAQLGRYSPNQKDIVLAGGFPARDKINSPLWQWQLNPGLIYEPEQGKFQAQDKQSFTNGYDLIYSSISYGGMSGGPVFDTEGKVIGIHGQAETTEKAEILLGNSQGISIKTFIGIADKLKVKPQLLKIANNKPAELNTTNRQTIITTMENLTPPQSGDDGERWLAYGNQLYRTFQLNKSVAAFDTAIAKGKGLTGNYGKALSLFRSGKFELAEIAIARAIAAVPASRRANYYYFWKYKSANFRLLEKYDDALNVINVAIELEPNDPILYSDKALILARSRKYLEAIAIYSDLIRIKPDDAYIYNNRGTTKSDLGEKQEAIRDYDRAIEINPQFYWAYSNRGNAKSSIGNKQGAISDYDRAIEINPQFAVAYYNRGNFKSDLANHQGAISDYNRAIEINSQYVKAYYNRGNSKFALGNKQGAISDYNRVIAINPQDADAYYNRGTAKLDLGNKQGAITDYDRAIAINPQYAQAYNNRGIIKSILGSKQEAIGDVSKAAELFRQQGRMEDYQRAMDLIAKLKGS
jgi:tetratricopeptide (TPR) repeat protein